MSKNLLKLTVLTIFLTTALFAATNAEDSSQPSLSAESLSPGVVIGHTWYDNQQNSRMGRMIDVYAPDNHVYFTWMKMEVIKDHRVNVWRDYEPAQGTFWPEENPDWFDQRGGYVNVDATNHLPYMTGHYLSDWTDDAPLHIHAYYMTHAFVFDPYYFIVPDSLASYGSQMGDNYSNLWPTMQVQLGTDTIMHVFAQSELSADNDTTHAIYYYRRLGIEKNAVWDYPPYIVDTVSLIAQEVVADRGSDKIALVWLANAETEPGCDTCSVNNDSEYETDLYYQISYDQGTTWQPRVNVTQNDPGMIGYRPSGDLSTLIDSQNELHIVVASRKWNGSLETSDINACRLLHWSETINEFSTIKTALDLGEGECTPGKNNLWLAKPQLSECNGNLYTTWVDFSGGATGDCAAWGTSGAANGELFVAASNSGGMYWGEPFNLTNTPTPGCDPSLGVNCASEHWASMNRFGSTVLSGDDWSQAIIINPDPAHPYQGDSYLDIQYIEDKDAGSAVVGEGSWQDDNLRWFRMACYDPIVAIAPCCSGLRGNIDGDIDDIQDISDLVYFVDFQFRGGDEPPCFEEADVNADGVIDIEDLVCMVDHQFRNDNECIQNCIVE